VWVFSVLNKKDCDYIYIMYVNVSLPVCVCLYTYVCLFIYSCVLCCIFPRHLF